MPGMTIRIKTMTTWICNLFCPAFALDQSMSTFGNPIIVKKVGKFISTYVVSMRDPYNLDTGATDADRPA